MLARCIQELEARTTAEVVLVLRRSSGNYRDTDSFFAALVTLVALCISLYSPWEVDPYSLPLPLVLLYFLAMRVSVSLGRYGPRRFFTRAMRRDIQVRHAAYSCFHEKKIAHTQAHTGILLYFSALEQQAELVADHCAEVALGTQLPELKQTLREACARPTTITASVEALAEFLRTFGVLLGKVLPWDPSSGSEHPNELDDTPDLNGRSDL
jgi:uncharacterized membrane protein